MLNVIICEDEATERASMKQVIENVIMIDDIDMKISLDTEDPYKVISYLQSKHSTGIYFIDLTLNTDISGIELASKIRELDPRGYIVIITASSESLPLIVQYKIEPLDYIYKKDYFTIRDKIEDCVRTAYNRHLTQFPEQKSLIIKIKNNIKSIEFDDILSIETSTNKFDHLLILKTLSSEYRWPSSIKSVLGSLDSRFIHINQSCIVNKQYVIDFNKKYRAITLKNGTKFTVARNKIREISNDLIKN